MIPMLFLLAGVETFEVRQSPDPFERTALIGLQAIEPLTDRLSAGMVVIYRPGPDNLTIGASLAWRINGGGGGKEE